MLHYMIIMANDLGKDHRGVSHSMADFNMKLQIIPITFIKSFLPIHSLLDPSCRIIVNLLSFEVLILLMWEILLLGWRHLFSEKITSKLEVRLNFLLKALNFGKVLVVSSPYWKLTMITLLLLYLKVFMNFIMWDFLCSLIHHNFLMVIVKLVLVFFYLYSFS